MGTVSNPRGLPPSHTALPPRANEPPICPPQFGGFSYAKKGMAANAATNELDRRIAVMRDNLRQLVEQEAAQSGAANESWIADRIAECEEQRHHCSKSAELLATSDQPRIHHGPTIRS